MAWPVSLLDPQYRARLSGVHVLESVQKRAGNRKQRKQDARRQRQLSAQYEHCAAPGFTFCFNTDACFPKDRIVPTIPVVPHRDSFNIFALRCVQSL
jgi:hypothetical protein